MLQPSFSVIISLLLFKLKYSPFSYDDGYKHSQYTANMLIKKENNVLVNVSVSLNKL